MKKLVVVLAMISCVQTMHAQWVSKQKDGSYKIDTTILCNNVEGYMGPVPVEITVKNDVIVNVVALENEETPKYWRLVQEKLLPKYKGKSVKEILTKQPDGVSGATYTSKAIKTNVKVGLQEYQKTKK